MKRLRNQEGFVLVTGLLTLVVLTFLGLAATRNTSIELKIAGNDRVHQESFYDAEATVILGSELLEQNFNCPSGFSKSLGNSAAGATNEPADTQYSLVENQIRVYNQGNNIALWRNPQPREWTDTGGWTINRDIYDPADADAAYPAANIATGVNVGYLYMGGYAELLPGGALQMAAGYEGKGKGSAAGGVARILDIYAVHNGELNSQSCVVIGWRHVIGSEGDCIY
ncbi:MAG: hypothetical protein Kow0089_17360 [Desulfobulbaceae bacterium]